MHKSIVVPFLAAVAFCALPGTHLMATVIAPIGLAPGSQYQLIFVTADGTAGSDPVIGDYNLFVGAQALASSSPVVAGAAWSAVVSTATTAAAANAPSTGAYPVYNTAGQLVEDLGVSLYGNLLVNPPLYDQFGVAISTTVWTGTEDAPDPGYGYPGYTLGNTDAIYGEDSDVNSSWLTESANFTPLLYPIYALSGPITFPVPEPSSLVLCGFAALGFAVAARQRMRQRSA